MQTRLSQNKNIERVHFFLYFYLHFSSIEFESCKCRKSNRHTHTFTLTGGLFIFQYAHNSFLNWIFFVVAAICLSSFLVSEHSSAIGWLAILVLNWQKRLLFFPVFCLLFVFVFRFAYAMNRNTLLDCEKCFYAHRFVVVFSTAQSEKKLAVLT